MWSSQNVHAIQYSYKFSIVIEGKCLRITEKCAHVCLENHSSLVALLCLYAMTYRTRILMINTLISYSGI